MHTPRNNDLAQLRARLLVSTRRTSDALHAPMPTGLPEPPDRWRWRQAPNGDLQLIQILPYGKCVVSLKNHDAITIQIEEAQYHRGVVLVVDVPEAAFACLRQVHGYWAEIDHQTQDNFREREHSPYGEAPDSDELVVYANPPPQQHDPIGRLISATLDLKAMPIVIATCACVLTIGVASAFVAHPFLALAGLTWIAIAWRNRRR